MFVLPLKTFDLGERMADARGISDKHGKIVAVNMLRDDAEKICEIVNCYHYLRTYFRTARIRPRDEEGNPTTPKPDAEVIDVVMIKNKWIPYDSIPMIAGLREEQLEFCD